jgi:AcrR family transcriptional regulator
MANGRLYAQAARAAPDLLPASDARPQARRLLEAAVVAFAERGYHGMSVRDLTSAVGIQAASFYSHFPSKERLLYELMLLGYQRHQAAVRDALLAAGADPADQLRQAMRANVRFQGTYPLLTIVCNTELHALAPENRARILSLRHDVGALVDAVIERGNETGAFACEHPWLAVMALGAMGQRLAWWYRPKPADDSPLSGYPTEAAKWLSSDYDLDQIADEYAEYVLRIVRHKGSA